MPALLRVSLAVELIKRGQVEDAKKVLKVAVQQDPQLRAVILDHPGEVDRVRDRAPYLFVGWN